MPVVERAIEAATLMLGSDRSSGYCLEMICADFLAGANLDQGDPGTPPICDNYFRVKWVIAGLRTRFLYSPLWTGTE